MPELDDELEDELELEDEEVELELDEALELELELDDGLVLSPPHAARLSPINNKLPRINAGVFSKLLVMVCVLFGGCIFVMAKGSNAQIWVHG